MLHKKKTIHLFGFVVFLIFGTIPLITMKTRPFITVIVVTILTTQHLHEGNAKAEIAFKSGFHQLSCCYKI